MPELAVAPDAAAAVVPGRVGARIGHVGVALPARRVGNDAIAARSGVDSDWIVKRTGIAERRVVADDETLADLAVAAGRDALASAELDPLDVDLVLVGTMSADHLTPNAAPLVAHGLGAARAGAIDVGAACTAFVSAVALAAAQIEAGRARHVLVVGADTLTRFTDWEDRKTAALFGDGAGAVVMSAVPGEGSIGPVVLGADGAEPGLLIATRERGVIEMDGQEVFRQAVDRMAECTRDACAAAGVGLADVDLFVFHQANSRILRGVGERLGLAAERVVDCIGPHGNTSAASIPIAFAAARRDGRLVDGARVLVCAFGAGFTWGGVVVEWGSPA